MLLMYKAGDINIISYLMNQSSDINIISYLGGP